MGVVNIEARLEVAQLKLKEAGLELEAVSPMFRQQVKAVLGPLLEAVGLLADAVEGVNREL